MGLRVRSTHEPTNEEREHDTRCYLMINLECIIGPPVNQALWAILWHAEISRLLACGRVIAKDQLERVKEKKLAAIANLVAQKCTFCIYHDFFILLILGAREGKNAIRSGILLLGNMRHYRPKIARSR